MTLFWREIGSEFWSQYEATNRQHKKNEAILLSGRTALKFIIDDIYHRKKVHKVLMPSYCCDSMIVPFIQSDIKVSFYPVHQDAIEIPEEHDADIVFLIDYFGYCLKQNSFVASREKQKGRIIIYDSTHKLDGNPMVETYADYSFCSYRKWFFCNYANAIRHNGVFENACKPKSNEAYVRLRNDAAYEKSKYITGIIGNKEEFLAKFRTAEELLDTDYIGYLGTPVNFDMQEIISRRRENADFLLTALNDIPQLKPWRSELQPEDTPLFVPILLDPKIRDELRRYLISKQIYCPIHWPRTSHQTMDNELYDTALSLICDQRYDMTDMARMVDVIKDFFNK